MLNSLPVRLLWHSLNWLTRLAIVASAVMAVLMALTIIVLRYLLLPDIERFHEPITASFAAALGNPISIGKIEGDWQGLQPRLNLSEVRILDAQGRPALVLPRVSTSLSWMSLLTAELRLASLEIDQPSLLILRDAQGKIFIGGLALTRRGSSNDLADWLLHQPRMVARGAFIVWVDEQRGAPPLVLQQVDLRIENRFRRHRFALRARPPEALSTPLDVRGDFYGASFDALDKWRGTLFTQLDYADVTAWRPWLDLPSAFSQGRGALRGWLNIEDGKLAGLTADLRLRDVATRLGADVPELVVADLRGRVAWQRLAGGFDVATQNLGLRLRSGLELQPTDFYFRTVHPDPAQPASGEIRANQLRLESLVSLANFLPLDAVLRARLDAYAPSGQVTNLDAQWQGSFERLDSYRVKGEFENLGLRQVGELPGFSGLTMDVDGGDASGRLNINSRDLTVAAPGVMREPLAFATLTGQADWRRKRGGELVINVNNVAAANDDLAGNLYGSYQTRAGTLGLLDLTVSLTRGDVRRAARYTPLVAVGQEANDWLNSALLAGHTEDLRIRVKGNLSDFPPNGKNNALLEIGGHAEGVVLAFEKDWPRIENISGQLLIHDNKLEVKSPSATILGAQLKNVAVTLPDMTSPDLPLEVRGEADAPSNVFLQFIQQSPVRGYIDGFTDGMSATGAAHLSLFTRVPLAGTKPVIVAGSVYVQDNDINLGAGMPLLRNTRGTLRFTETGMQATDVATAILGGPATLNVTTEAGGVVHATVQGRNNLDALPRHSPLLDYLHGGADWNADVSVVKKTVEVVVDSDLEGISSSLPPPFAKVAAATMPLHVELKPVASPPGAPSSSPEENIVSVQLGQLLSARLLSRGQEGGAVLQRGTVNFGVQTKGARIPTEEELLHGRDGIWLTGSLPLVSLEGWDGLLGGWSGSTGALPLAGARLQIGKLAGYGQTITDLRIDAARRGDGLAAQLASTSLNGEVEWQPGGARPNGKVTALLRNVHWTTAAQPTAGAEVARPGAAAAETLQPGKLPALEVVVDDLQVQDKHIGRLELSGDPEGADWRLRRLNISSPDGSLTGDGTWFGRPVNAAVGAGERTQINLLLEISDAGKMLDRFGYPHTVRKGSGKLAADLSWAGRPDQFSYANLDGTLKLDTGKGQFLKMEPGIGKLLSILSLQALPRHITLDFTDVFSEGFQFDNINGNATIRHGVMETQDFHIDGSSAKVTMQGSVDLNNETQNLRVVILPTIGDSMSLLSVLAAGPAVGIGSFIVNKVLGNPLDKLVSFEYNISGTWSDPTVVKVGRQSAKSPENILNN